MLGNIQELHTKIHHIWGEGLCLNKGGRLLGYRHGRQGRWGLGTLTSTSWITT